jgi:hypothetical protein
MSATTEMKIQKNMIHRKKTSMYQKTSKNVVSAKTNTASFSGIPTDHGGF